MADSPQYTVLGNAEAYQEDATRARSGGEPEPHRSLADAQAALRPQIAAVESAVRVMPREQRLDEVVVEMRLDASRTAKSYHPSALLREAGLHLRGVGTWQQELTGTRAQRARDATDEGATPGSSPATRSVMCRTLLVSGPERAFAALSRIIEQPNRFERDVIGLERIHIPASDERLAVSPATTPTTAVEIVLYAWDNTRRDQAINAVRRVLIGAGVDAAQILVRSYDQGPTFLAAVVPTVALPNLGALNFLRLARALPRVQLTRTALGMQVAAPSVPNGIAPPVAAIAVFDGGVAPLEHFRGLVHYTELTNRPCPPDLLEHGTAVVGAAIYGELVPGQPLPPPRCQVHAFRVMPDPLGSDLELWGVIDRLEERVPRLPAEVKVINLSVGPLGPIDDIPCRFTYAIDSLSYTYDKLFITAVGNWGEDPDHQLRRIQSPADAVNAISIGAFTREPTTGQRTRASYSSVGPGRAGCARKPELLAFGGCARVPFYSLDPQPGSMRGTTGTSYAAPTVAALAGQLIANSAVSPQGCRALLLHTARPLTDDLQAAIGVAGESIEEILTCTPNRVSVLYQGSLTPRGCWRLPFLIPPGLALPGNVHLSWTLVYCSETDQAAHDEYTLGGIEIQFRPNAQRFSWNPPDGSPESARQLHLVQDAAVIASLETANWKKALNPVSDSGRRTEITLRNMDSKWDTIVPGQRTKRGSGLDDPALTVSFVGRSNWHDAADDLIRAPFAAVLTVQAERHEGDLYATMARTYAELQALAITNRVAVPISLGRSGPA